VWPLSTRHVYQWNRLIFSDTAMSGRLASFKGPSTPLSPESSPSGKKKSSNNRGTVTGNKGGANPTPPASPGRELESTFHRKTRALLLEVRSICRLWSDIVLRDGLKAAKTLVDARTELEYVSKSVFLDYPPALPNRALVERSNALATLPPGETPKYRIAGPKLRIMDKQIRDLDNVLAKLVSLRYQIWGFFFRLIRGLGKPSGEVEFGSR